MLSAARQYQETDSFRSAEDVKVARRMWPIEAVAAEDYETAAKLRDELRKFEDQPS